jgi:hypothetical protein
VRFARFFCGGHAVTHSAAYASALETRFGGAMDNSYTMVPISSSIKLIFEKRTRFFSMVPFQNA